MNKIEAFRQATEKNAIRKGCLPLLDMRDEMARIEYGEAIRNYRDATKRYAEDRKRIIAEVLTEKRAEQGDAYGYGGMHAVYVIAAQRFRDFLEVRGVPYPKRPEAAGPAITYGDKAD